MKRLFFLSLLAALTAFGADIAGKWKGTYTSPNGPVEVNFVFQVNDGKLTGTATGPRGESPLTGKVEGDKVDFTVARDDFKAVATGTISGDKLKLTVTVGERSIEILCERP